MQNLPATVAAGFAVLLFGVGLVAMTGRALRVAGFCFLGASLVIYFRETRLLDS